MKLPIVKIAELTGIHRDTISKRLADLPFEAGKKGAKLYSSEDALAAIYKTDSLEAARAEVFQDCLCECFSVSNSPLAETSLSPSFSKLFGNVGSCFL